VPAAGSAAPIRLAPDPVKIPLPPARRGGHRTRSAARRNGRRPARAGVPVRAPARRR